MSCSVLSFSGLSSSVITKLVRRANQYGADLRDPLPAHGERKIMTAQGQFEFAWNFDPIHEIGEIQCTDSPTVVSCAVVRERIVEVVTACGGQSEHAYRRATLRILRWG